MKKILFAFLIVLALEAKPQFILEHDYSAASTYSGNQLMMIDFEILGEKYVLIDRNTKNLSIYSLNHSLYKSIVLTSLTPGINSGTVDDILYLSQSLFNLDTNIEFMYCKDCASPSQSKIWVYDETGAVLFSDTAGIPIRTNIPEQQLPIYNSSQGTKMILSYPNGHAKVWGLAGALTTAIQEASNQLLKYQSRLSNPAPNPVQGTTKIEYTLPKEVREGVIVFYDLQGAEIKRYTVDNTFDHLLISSADIPAGTYYYQLKTANDASAAKKIVVIK